MKQAGNPHSVHNPEFIQSPRNSERFTIINQLFQYHQDNLVLDFMRKPRELPNLNPEIYNKWLK